MATFIHPQPTNTTQHNIKSNETAGGTRAVPPPDKLEAFLRAAGTLDVEVVGGVVLDQLGEESWQVSGVEG